MTPNVLYAVNEPVFLTEFSHVTFVHATVPGAYMDDIGRVEFVQTVK